MKAISAREAKYNFGRLIDDARVDPVVVEKHGRPFVVVLSVEEYERLNTLDRGKIQKSQAPMSGNSNFD